MKNGRKERKKERKKEIGIMPPYDLYGPWCEPRNRKCNSWTFILFLCFWRLWSLFILLLHSIWCIGWTPVTCCEYFGPQIDVSIIACCQFGDIVLNALGQWIQNNCRFPHFNHNFLHSTCYIYYYYYCLEWILFINLHDYHWYWHA